MAYAKTTSVSRDKSEMQIKGLLRKHGANGIMIGEDSTRVGIQFSMAGRHVRFVVPMPTSDDDDIKFTDGGKVREGQALQNAIEQAMRSRFRLLFLVVKAKLEAVESNVVTFEDEFLAHTVMADGLTVGEWAKPQLRVMYDTGNMPPLLGHMT